MIFVNVSIFYCNISISHTLLFKILASKILPFFFFFYKLKVCSSPALSNDGYHFLALKSV